MTPKDFLSVVEQAWPEPVVYETTVSWLFSNYPNPSLSFDDEGWLSLFLGDCRIGMWHPGHEESMWAFRSFLMGMIAGARELRWKALEVLG